MDPLSIIIIIAVVILLSALWLNKILSRQDKNGVTALMLASQDGQTSEVEALLAKDANVDLQSDIGATALILATQNDHVAVVNALLAKAANVEILDKKGLSALMIASSKGHEVVVQALLDKGVGCYDGDVTSLPLDVGFTEGYRIGLLRYFSLGDEEFLVLDKQYRILVCQRCVQ